MHAFAGNHSRCEYARTRPDVMMQVATTRCNGSIRLLKTWKIGPFIFRRFTQRRGVNVKLGMNICVKNGRYSHLEGVSYRFLGLWAPAVLLVCGFGGTDGWLEW